MHLDRVKRALHPPSNVTNRLQEKKLTAFLESFEERSLILDLGAGRKKTRADIISIDIYPAPGVTLLGDIHNLPLDSCSIDGVIARGVLEHVRYPDKVINEIFRVLKPGGKVFSSIPFMQGYHPSPGDYHRYTIDGIQLLFSRFSKLECGITRGSASAYVWIAREFFSEILSFNNITLYKILKIIFGWLLQPVKYLDPLTEKHARAHIVASGFTFLGQKPVP
ncbi:MAG: class I SAM-dependent methyltransferase [Candidatus Krumholzibacteriota bacterium]|nr:class I SAM-dependent methyltransferase [Candidatus Krumholzibacteriota bacterium]